MQITSYTNYGNTYFIGIAYNIMLCFIMKDIISNYNIEDLRVLIKHNISFYSINFFIYLVRKYLQAISVLNRFFYFNIFLFIIIYSKQSLLINYFFVINYQHS